MERSRKSRLVGKIVPYSSKFIPASELADQLGMDKSLLLKYVKAQGIEWSKMRTEESRGQLCCVLSPEQAKQLVHLRREQGYKV
jgi:hypothetical protein